MKKMKENQEYQDEKKGKRRNPQCKLKRKEGKEKIKSIMKKIRKKTRKQSKIPKRHCSRLKMQEYDKKKENYKQKQKK